MKKTLTILGMSALILLGTACNSDDDDIDNDISNNPYKKIELTRTEQEMVGANNDFAFNFFNQLSSLEGEKNMMVSPLSLAQALSMLANGADGNTKIELMNVLGFGAYSVEEMNAYYMNLNKGLLSADKTSKIALANSFWVNNRYKAKSDYKKVLKNSYNAELKELAFNNKTYNQINQWAERNTNGCIKELVSENEINSETVMALLNAIYFKASWESEFIENDNLRSDFTTPEGDVDVEYMTKNTIALGYKDENCKLLKLYYGNEAFNMVLLLPNEDKTLDQVLQGINGEKWQEMTNQITVLQNAEIQLPKFKGKYSYKENLKQALKNMGITDAFSLSANFSKMMGNPIFVNLIKQNTSMAIDEKGTEAAAVTIVGGYDSIGGPNWREEIFEFKATRPFFYLIEESSTDAILFMGKVTNPKE